MILAVWLPGNRQEIVNKYHNDGKGGRGDSNKKVGVGSELSDRHRLSVNIHAHAHAHAHILNTKTGYRTLYVNSTASGETAATFPFTALSVIGCTWHMAFTQYVFNTAT